MARIPGTADEISPEWLTEVLGLPVARCSVDEANSGTTGRAVLNLDYRGPDTGPRRVFVKLPPDDPAQREFVQTSGMGRREALFYRQLSAEVPVRVPDSYYAHSDDAGGRFIMLLEDLNESHCSFRNASTRYSLDYIRAVLDAFAALHSAYWDSPRFQADLDWVEPTLHHPITAPLLEQALSQFGARMPSVFREMGELYLANEAAIHDLWRQGTPTLIHGDVHDGNMFWDGDRPGFLDWALLARGPAMRDVGYFLAGTLEPADQDAQHRSLLDHYRGALLATGVTPPSVEDLYRQYRWHSAYVWIGAAVTLAMGDAWQPLSYVLGTLERLHHALETLGTVSAIREGLAEL